MTTITMGGELDWALVASLLVNVGLIALAVLQYTQAQREARLTRRPIVEIESVTWRDISNLVFPPEGFLSAALIVKVRNAGTGGADSVRLTGRIAEGWPIANTADVRSWIHESPTSHGAISHLPAGDSREVELRGYRNLPLFAAEIPVHFQQSACAAVDARCIDAYGKPHQVVGPRDTLFAYQSSAGLARTAPEVPSPPPPSTSST